MRNLFVFCCLSVVILCSCGNESGKQANANASEKPVIENHKEEDVQIDLPQIKEKGTLTAITSYSSTSFFIYKGQLMGFEYELLKWLAEYLDLELNIEVAENLDNLVSHLNSGKGDIIAHNLIVTQDRKEYLRFTDYHTLTTQVLVQRKPENWKSIPAHQLDENLIRSPLQLIDEEVHVRLNTAYYARLLNLSEEIGGKINIIPADGDLSIEEIIKQVADGKISYTVADKNIALLNQTYYPGLDTETEVGLPQRVAWAVRKNSPELHAAVNEWLKEIRGSAKYNVIYNKYFKNEKAFIRRAESEFFSRTGNKISPYDTIIKTYAAEIDWDWRLLASLINQESDFNVNAKSWAGAIGLMQVLPGTARSFGISDLYNPWQNVNAGTAYIKYLTDFWEEIPDTLMRRKFILASYNAGPGHVEDARNLAKKYKKDPNIWEGNVADYLRLKSNPKYYNDEVVKYGYCRGDEPYYYVREIAERYEHYAAFIE